MMMISISETGIGNRIRRLARRSGYLATKSRKNGMWYFIDDRNTLVSWERGLDLQEAYEWITETGVSV
jgi:hypothetical protein